MQEKNNTYLTQIGNSKAKTQMDTAERVVNNLKIEELSDAQKNELIKTLAKKLGNFNHSIQISGGNQIIGQNQFIVDKEVFKGVVSGIVEALVKHLGQEAVTEIMKEMMKVVIEKI